MKNSNTSIRLKEIMAKRDLKQVDILNLCAPLCKKYGIKLGRNDISQYVNGKVEPKQDKLSVLAEALGVTEPYLMGYDEEETPSIDDEIIRLFRQLSEDDKAKVIEYTLLLIKASEQGK